MHVHWTDAYKLAMHGENWHIMEEILNLKCHWNLCKCCQSDTMSLPGPNVKHKKYQSWQFSWPLLPGSNVKHKCFFLADGLGTKGPRYCHDHQSHRAGSSRHYQTYTPVILIKSHSYNHICDYANDWGDNTNRALLRSLSIIKVWSDDSNYCHHLQINATSWLSGKAKVRPILAGDWQPGLRPDRCPHA